MEGFLRHECPKALSWSTVNSLDRNYLLQMQSWKFEMKSLDKENFPQLRASVAPTKIQNFKMDDSVDAPPFEFGTPSLTMAGYSSYRGQARLSSPPSRAGICKA